MALPQLSQFFVFLYIYVPFLYIIFCIVFFIEVTLVSLILFCRIANCCLVKSTKVLKSLKSLIFSQIFEFLQ